MRPQTRPAGRSWTTTLPMRKRESLTVSSGSSERRIRRMGIFGGSLRAVFGEDIFKQIQRKEFCEDRRRKARRGIRYPCAENLRRRDTKEPRASDSRAQNPVRRASVWRQFPGLGTGWELLCGGARCRRGSGDRLWARRTRRLWLQSEGPLGYA